MLTPPPTPSLASDATSFLTSPGLPCDAEAPLVAVAGARPDARLDGVEQVTTAAATIASAEPARPAEPAVPAAPASAPRPRRSERTGSRRLQVLTTVATWLVTGVAGLVVLGLLAITVGPRFLPYEALVVRSGSMSPTIPTGSVVFYHKETASQIKVGQIIVFSEPGNPNVKITHRVHAILTEATGRYFITKGDANATPDDWQVPAVGSGWVAGYHVPEIGYLLVDLESIQARLLLLVVPAALLGLIALYELWREPGRGGTSETGETLEAPGSPA